MLSALKRFLVGQPLRTSQAVHERLTKRVALAVFASDALSSVAYATEEILLVLAVAAITSRCNRFWLPVTGPRGQAPRCRLCCRIAPVI